jgi:origin recognition complex subunit 3
MVLAFQDTEAFPMSIISEFIIRHNERLRRLPIVLLFGVASTLDQFQQMLPTCVIKSLDTKIFKVRENDECLGIIIDKVPPNQHVNQVLMANDVGLRLGPKVLRFLIDRYHSWNQSVEDFISGVKVPQAKRGLM